MDRTTARASTCSGLIESGQAQWGKWTDSQHWNNIDHRADDIAGIRVMFQRDNRGKGASVRAALRIARGDWVIVQDADLEYDPQEYLLLLNAAQQVLAAPRRVRRPVAVFGSRLLDSHTRAAQGRSALVAGRIGLTFLFRLLYGRSLSDVSTCYKLMPRRLAQRLPLRCDGFDLDFELAARLVRAGARLLEVPISYAPRSAAQGKKLRAWRDGWRAALALVRARVF
jgi:glycosyltransferase involved in cell wall biosynthesis